MSKNFLKRLKTSLTTISTIALMLHGNSALAAADAIVTNNADLTTGVGLNPAAIFGGGTLQYNSKGVWTVDANIAGGVILAIDTDKGSTPQVPGILTVNENTSIGSIRRTGLYNNRLPIEIAGNKTLTLTGTAGTGIAADIYEGLESIDFGAGAVLIGNAASGMPITLTNSIINGVNGTLNAQTPMIFSHTSATTFNIINIEAGSSITIDAQGGSLNLNGDAIKFADAASVLQLKSFANRTITLTTNLLGKAGGGGIVKLIGGGAGSSLTLRSKTGAETLGTGVNKLAQLAVGEKVVISGAVGAKLNISNALVLNVYSGATFIDESTTSARIPQINIGADAGQGVGRAVYTVDVSQAAGDVDFLVAGAGNVLTFLNKASELTVQNIVAADRTVIFNNNIVGINGGGRVNLSSTGGNILTIKGADAGAGAPQFGNGTDIASLNITGKVTIAGGGDLLDVSRSDVLNINSAAIFTDEGATSARIPQINIGTRGGMGAGIKYIVDVSQAAGDVDFLAAGAGNILTVLDTNSQLIVTNKAAVDKTVIFNNNVVVDNGGGCLVGFVNKNPASTLIVKGANNSQLGQRNNIAFLGIIGKVTITGGLDLLDVSRTNRLTLQRGAVFTDEGATSAGIHEIRIGDAAGKGVTEYIVDVSQAAGDVEFLKVGGGSTLSFLVPNSRLTVRNTGAADRTVIFNNNVVGVGGGGGQVGFTNNNPASNLIVKGVNNPQFGNFNNIALLDITGKVTIRGAADIIDVSRSNRLDVNNGAIFTDESATSTDIAEINIGADEGNGAGVGTATYAIDVSQGGNIDVLKVADSIRFLDPNSMFQIQNIIVNADTTVTFKNILNGGVIPAGGGGVVGDGGIVK